MRALFTSDLQLDSSSRFDTPDAPRLEANAETLFRIVDLANERNADVLVVAGDVFQHRRPAVDELLVFQRFLDACQESLLPVYLLAGNHDVRAPGSPATIELFDRVGCDAIVRPRVVAGTDLAFLPWAHPGTVRASYPGASGEDFAELLLTVAENLADQDVYPVLVTHYALSGMSLPNGLPTSALREPVLDIRALAEQGWRYVLAGHIHKPEAVTFDQAGLTVGAAVSIGSPWRHDFGEATIEPGVVFLDTESSKVEHEPLEDRSFVTVDFEAEELDDGRLTVGGAPVDVVGAIVRVRVKCSDEQAPDLPLDNVRRNLETLGAHKVFIHLDVERRARARADVPDDSEPLAALEAWSAIMGIDGQPRERLRGLTQELLGGEE